MIRVSLTKAENQKAQISVKGNFRTKFNTGYNNSTNKYQAVENDTILDYLTRSNGWKVLGDTTRENQSLSKVFSFDSLPQSVKFSYLVSDLAQMLNHHPIIHIDWDKVTIDVNTWALNNSISNFDLRSAILLDQLYELIVNDDL